MATQHAIFAGGCFWCLEALFSRLQGVSVVISGYIGGHVANPRYEQVCLGTTGHAEAINIAFDPSMISYTALLHLFFKIHNPTTLNRQGNDVGTQYRSAIFYLNDQQRIDAENMINELTVTEVFSNPIVTEVIAASHFFAAEEYHQHYFDTHTHAPYCQNVIAPKLQTFLDLFKLAADPSHNTR